MSLTPTSADTQMSAAAPGLPTATAEPLPGQSGQADAPTWGERLFKRIVIDPRVYPPHNYHLPQGRARRWAGQAGSAALRAFSPRVGRWEALYGSPRPALVALDAPKVGGSHFVLHHLQRHPQLLCLHEGVLAVDSRTYLRSGECRIYDLAARQLIPYRRELGRVKYVVLNKPVMDTIYARYWKDRPRIFVLQLLRNPVAYCLSRAAANPSSDLEQTRRENYELARLRAEMRRAADFFDPAQDMAVTLEHFATHPARALAAVEAHLGLEPAGLGAALALERCARCGGALRTEARPVKSRPPEPVLLCADCGAAYIGPGGFNLLRHVQPAEFDRWARDPRAPRLWALCEAFYGAPYMDYFRQRRYLEPEGGREFSRVFQELLQRLKGA